MKPVFGKRHGGNVNSYYEDLYYRVSAAYHSHH